MKRMLLLLALGGVMLSTPVANAGECQVKKACGMKKEHCHKKKRCHMKKQCGVKKSCHVKKQCPPKECHIACDKMPAPEIHGVLCEPRMVKRVEYCPQPNEPKQRFVPCPPVRKVRCVPQPDRQEVNWRKEVICVPQPPKEEVVWHKEIINVPQPAKEEVYYEQPEDKCCTEEVCVPPKKIVRECLEYFPINVCNNSGHKQNNLNENAMAEEEMSK